MTASAKGFPIAKAARKDSAVHVSLSSDSPVKQPDAPARSDVATRTWPRDHGPMLGHRVNSEGLRRRAIAPSGGAPKRMIYSLRPPSLSTFGHAKSPVDRRKSGKFCRSPPGPGRLPPAAANDRAEPLDAGWNSAFARLAPHCGHIRRPFFARRIDVAARGMRQYQFSYEPRPTGSLLRSGIGEAACADPDSRARSRLQRRSRVTWSRTRGL